MVFTSPAGRLTQLSELASRNSTTPRSSRSICCVKYTLPETGSLTFLDCDGIPIEGKKIEWDGPNMTVANVPEADPLIRRAYRESINAAIDDYRRKHGASQAAEPKAA